MAKQKNTDKLSTCEQCQIRKEAPLYNVYHPNCLQCGADGIKGLQRMNIDKTEKKTRLTAWLKYWIKFGHNEQDIRKMAKT